MHVFPDVPARCKALDKLDVGSRAYSLRGSNPRPMAHKTIALTTELREPMAIFLDMQTLGSSAFLATRALCRNGCLRASAPARARAHVSYAQPRG